MTKKKKRIEAKPDQDRLKADVEKMSAETAKDLIYGAKQEEDIKQFLELPVKDFERLAFPQSLSDGIKLQKLKRKADKLGYLNETRRAWEERVWRPMIFRSCVHLCSDVGDPEADEKLRAWIKESADGERVSISSDWIFVRTGALRTRALLAVELCKLNSVAVPPAWLRDLHFYQHYPKPACEERADFMPNLLEQIKSFLTEQAIKRIREGTKRDFGRGHHSADQAAEALGLDAKTLEIRRQKLKREINRHFQNDFQPTIEDLLSWNIDLENLRQKISNT